MLCVSGGGNLMIHDIEIHTMDDLFRMVSEQEYREDLGRNRDLFVYRGEPDASFTLSTSLKRNCKDKRTLLEPTMLLNFTKYAVLEEPTIEKSIWNQMILGQHHGLPTRLLDWTFAPMVALHFAMTENDLEMMDAHDSVVWRIDIHELHAMLPLKYRRIIRKYNTTVFSVDMLNEACSSLHQYDEDMQDRCMAVIEPPSFDPRIINQYSFFSVVPGKMENVTEFLNRHTNLTARYIIDKKLRWRIRDMLDHHNITERIVYPGLDGLSRWLGRHYFVKS